MSSVEARFLNQLAIYWCHIKPIPLPYTLGYGGLIFNWKCLSGRPKCRWTLVNAGATQAKTGRKSTVLKWCENMKCLSSQAVTWLFLRVGQAVIHHLKEESELSADENFLNFFQIAIFKHIFESRRAWPKSPYILVCHLVTSCQISGYYTPIWRGYPEPPYDHNSLNIHGVIKELRAHNCQWFFCLVLCCSLIFCITLNLVEDTPRKHACSTWITFIKDDFSITNRENTTY